MAYVQKLKDASFYDTDRDLRNATDFDNLMSVHVQSCTLKMNDEVKDTRNSLPSKIT